MGRKVAPVIYMHNSVPVAYMGKVKMKMGKLKPCPFCGKEIDTEKNVYISERDWAPSFYDPDSGGNPIVIHCECGLTFYTDTWDWKEAVEIWNKRVNKEDTK